MVSRQTTALFAIVGLLMCLLILRGVDSKADYHRSLPMEDAQLRAEIAQLKQKVVDLEALANSSQPQRCTAPPPSPTALPSPHTAPPSPWHLENQTLLLLPHRLWDWKTIVHDLMQHWPRIEIGQVESAVDACHNSSMYCSRMQVHDGKLYLIDYRAIFFDRHCAHFAHSSLPMPSPLGNTECCRRLGRRACEDIAAPGDAEEAPKASEYRYRRRCK